MSSKQTHATDNQTATRRNADTSMQVQTPVDAAPLQTLDRDTQALALYAVAQQALRQYAMPVRQITLLANHINAVFRIDLADGSLRVLRVGHPTWRSDDDLRTELAWLTALVEDAPDIGAAQPLANREGALVTLATTPDAPEPRRCVLFSWVPGQHLGEVVTLEHVQRLGSLMARLHTQAAAMPLPPDTFARRFDRIFPHGATPLYADPRFVSAFTHEQRTILTAALAQATVGLATLAEDTHHWFPIHVDLHHRNVLVDGDCPRPIDFEDALLGHPLQDIVMTLFDLQAHTSMGTIEPARLRAAFADGYTRLRPWPAHTAETFTAMFLVRRIWTINWALRTQTGAARDEALQRICAELQRLLMHDA